MALATLNPHPAISSLQYKPSSFQSRFDAQADSLPNGFPIAFTTDLAWNGPTLTEEAQYAYTLTDDQILEIEAALTFFKALGLDGDLVTPETFPLPSLRHILYVLCNEIHNGKGFFVLRGLDPAKYSVEDSMVIFLGIQAYIAEQRARQDDKGNMIVHIISEAPTTLSPTTNLHARHSKKSISFHTEETGDIIAWQTRNTAARGGSCIISSSHTIYNILATTRPDIIRTLAEPDWPFALPHFHRRPIIYYHSSHLFINFSRTALLGNAAHPRPSHLPSLTPAQRESLDVLESIARGVELKIKTRPGDLHFVNNLAVLHRRDEFIDWDDEDDDAVEDKDNKNDSKPNKDGGIVRGYNDGGHNHGGYNSGNGKKKRHLVRMRIRNAKLGWQLPAELQGEWEKVFGVEGERVWHLEPMPEGFFPLRMNPH